MSFKPEATQSIQNPLDSSKSLPSMHSNFTVGFVPRIALPCAMLGCALYFGVRAWIRFGEALGTPIKEFEVKPWKFGTSSNFWKFEMLKLKQFVPRVGGDGLEGDHVRAGAFVVAGAAHEFCIKLNLCIFVMSH